EGAGHPDVGFRREKIFGAVAVMNVEIDHRRPRQSVSGERMRDTNRDIVEQTKSHRPFARCMMTRRSYRTESGAAFAAHDQVGAQHYRACRMSRRLQRIGIERGVRFEMMNARPRDGRLALVDL